MSDSCKAPPAGWWCSRAEGHEGPCAARPMDAVPDFTFTIRPKPGCDRSLEDVVKHLASLLEKPLRVEVVGSAVEQFAAPLMATLDTTFDGSFSDALRALKDGKKVARRGWNGKGMWLILLQPSVSHSHGYAVKPCIGMKTATGRMQPGWLASQDDLLSDDWEVLP